MSSCSDSSPPTGPTPTRPDGISTPSTRAWPTTEHWGAMMPEPFLLEFRSGNLIYGIIGQRQGNNYTVERGGYVGTVGLPFAKVSPTDWSLRSHRFIFDDNCR